VGIYRSSQQMLVQEKLLLSEARRRQKDREAYDRQVTREVQHHLEKERRAAGGAEAFRKKIEESGLTYQEYVERIRSEVICANLLHSTVQRDLSISPVEIREYYEDNRERFTLPARATYRQIFIAAEKYETRDKAREAAERQLSLLEEGADFAALATENSDGPRANEGGLWQETRQGVRPQPVDKLIFSLPIGAVGGPVETEPGFTIVKVESRQGKEQIPLAEVQQKIENRLREKKQGRRYQRLIRRLEDENYVEFK